MRVEIQDGLRSVLRLGWAEYRGLDNAKESPAVRDEMEETAGRLRAEWAGRPLPDMEEVSRTRRLYKALGIDPTRHRPSSEALLRRAVRGKPLPRVNAVVDAINVASLRYQVPMGLYDADAVAGDAVMVRVGEDGDGYEGIGRGRINVAGRICLCDGVGPFGNPTADSDRTKVTLNTSRVYVATFHPREVTDSLVGEVLEGVTRLVLAAAGGEPVESGTP